MREYIAALKSQSTPRLYVMVMRFASEKPIPRMLFIEPYGSHVTMEPGGEYDVVLGIAEPEYEGINYGDHRDQWPMVQIIDEDAAIYIPQRTIEIAVFRAGQAICPRDVVER